MKAQTTSSRRAWRREQLLAAGFAPLLATKLAADRRLDLHALIELVERGCRPELAARILAPLDDVVSTEEVTDGKLSD